MKNPWQEIELSDYENHMKLDSISQLQRMNIMMKKQFNQYPIKTAMILGVAGGNGLEHIDPQKFEKVFCVDINHTYLTECMERYKNLNDLLEDLCVDLCAENIRLPHADLVIANLLIEYIGYECFQNAINQIKPTYVSCIIQINKDDGFISDSPYGHVLSKLSTVHHQIQEHELINIMKNIGYSLELKSAQPLPNGKKLVQLDFCSHTPS